MSETLEAPKVSLDGAQRACTPLETLERMRPFWGQAGLTRVADITSMDHIGIPVALSIRPDSGSLAVDSGKGLTVAAAKASAMMEAFERVSVERAEFDKANLYTASLKELEGEKALWDFPFVRGACLHRETPMLWIPCSDLITGAEMLVPQRCVGYELRDTEPLASKVWMNSTNGLAAGNTREEAVCAALYEVIERDAVTLALEANKPRALKQSAIPWASVQGLLEKINAAGCGASVIDATSEVGVPTYICFLFDRREPGIGIYRGYGTHLSPEVAMCRAVCEAAQARCVIVAGARDDITHERYLAFREVARTTDLSRWDLPQEVEEMAEDGSGATFREDIATLLERLEARGFGHVLMYDFDCHKANNAHVVRILVPGMEGYWCEWIAYGARARKAKEGK
jgi:ribosomal protein S12 methylthiotransferase accessory factor